MCYIIPYVKFGICLLTHLPWENGRVGGGGVGVGVAVGVGRGGGVSFNGIYQGCVAW